MLRDKGTKNLSELKNFFTTNEKAFFAIYNTLRSLKIDFKHFGFKKANNEKISTKMKLFLLIFFPFFSINNPANYYKSNIYKLFSFQKDIFYRLLKNQNILWRELVHCITLKIIHKSEKINYLGKGNKPKCLIIDDTDLPKTGRKMEWIGYVFSHVSGSYILGFKGLFLSFFDGSSFFPWDMSLHVEMGRNKKKPQGLSKKEAKKRYSKERDKNSAGKERENECFKSKMDMTIKLLASAFKQLKPDYVLVDSWFTCYRLVASVAKKAHFLGMIKMGKTKYLYNGKSLTCNDINRKLKATKKVVYSKKFKQYHRECIVDFQGIKIKLFFVKSSRRGKYRGIMTTNLELNFERAFEIYAIRWTTEIFFKEAKQYLGLGKCQSVDFDAQTASTSIVMLEYSLLSLAKKELEYQTIGGIFKDIQKDTQTPTLDERILLIIKELVLDLAEILEIPFEELITKIISENKQLMKWINLNPLSEAA